MDGTGVSHEYNAGTASGYASTALTQDPTSGASPPYPSESLPNQGLSANTAPYPSSQPQPPYPSQPQPTYLPPDAAALYPPQGVPYPTAEANPAYPPPPYPGPPNAGYNPYPPQTAGAPIDTKKYNPGTQPAGWQTTQPPSSGLPPANIVIVRSGQVDTGTEPESYLICSIFSVCFCLIFGIIAIVYSAQVSSLWTQGLHAESRRASMKARGWAISAFVVGSIIIIFNVIRAVAFY